MSNYRGITLGSVIAKLFAVILEQRIASWAEEHAVNAGTWVCVGESLMSSSLCMHTTAQQYGHYKAYLPSSDASRG